MVLEKHRKSLLKIGVLQREDIKKVINLLLLEG